MDSLTQIVLGAAVGEVTLGKKIGNKAQLIGAIAGTLPDLDVFVTMSQENDLAEIIIHRSYSHALFTHFIISFLLAWLTFLIFKKKVEYKSWYWLWFLGLSTHAILDSFTTYGTQLFLPFSDYIVGFNNISVIDPLYTLPFMGILIYCLCIKRDKPKRLKWAWRSIYISTGYMLLTFGIKYHIHQTVSTQLKQQGIAYNNLSTSPTILNSVLWSGMASTDSTITFAEYSLFQDNKTIDFISFKRNLQLEKSFQGYELDKLKWFSQGQYLLEQKDSTTINFYITKWGRMDMYQTAPTQTFRFYYELTKTQTGYKVTAIKPSFKEGKMGASFNQLWQRIWHK
ncbi:MAG: metal-dependent hydrolase [Bacteroidetes bacterium]|nr:metal-dependent hydrolase [Bacteroidota bacterium]